MKKNYWIILLGLILSVGPTLSAVAAETFIVPGGPFVNPCQVVRTDSILTFEEIEAKLYDLEARSKGLMTVETVGYSVLGQPLLAARIGHGETRMWIHGRIHGDERFGAEASLALLSILLSSNQSLLDQISFLVIQCLDSLC